MARRKRVLDDGDDSDSLDGSDNPDFDFENDPDAREERALFENPYGHKRRRRNGKEDALYGVFADNSEDEDIGRGGKASASKRSDWAKAPAFVSSDKPVTQESLNDAMAVDESEGEGERSATFEEGSDGSDEDGGEATGSEDEGKDEGSSDESEPSRAPSPRVLIEDDNDEEIPRPRMGGIGSSSGIGLSGRQQPQGFSSSRGGIGSQAAKVEEEQDIDSPVPGAFDTTMPSAFGKKSQSFTRAFNASPSPVALPAAEMAHFNKIQGSFGARMLAKMGWQAGSGLGASGEGIVIPIESKLRPQKMGIAFKGFKEKTEQSKLEAKRRGEVVSDDEDAKTKKFKKKAREQQEKRSDAWKRPKKVKTKIEHKTYEQILAEAGEIAPSSGIGQIIDATGAVPREVSSLADVSINSWAPSNDPTRIPEVRHNIRVIAEACKEDLDGLAREAKALHERKKFVAVEDARLRKRVEDEADLISRLQQIQIVANDIQTIAKELSSLYEVSLDPLSPPIQKLINEYSSEYDKYALDDIVVGAIAPVMRRIVTSWNPLEDPSSFLPTFRSWRRALKINEEPAPETKLDLYGSKTISTRPTELEQQMTPFESLLWNVWLPKVRTSINNDWSPEEPNKAVKLYEAWSTFLPSFIRDNLLDQLILPKVQKSVANWNAKLATVSLQTIVFPWLPHVGLRMEEVVGDARRKIRNVLRQWIVSEPIPTDLVAWKDVFDAGEWDAMILKYVVPKLGATLRNDFRINPRDQKMDSLLRVFAWSSIIRTSVMSQILETEFFPKWLDVLHIWLTQPRVNFNEVAMWYEFWKDTFPEVLRSLQGINRGFTRGLQLMNKAIELGPDAPTKLAKPDFLGEISIPSTPRRSEKDKGRTTKPSARTHEITFRSIVEDFAAANNLLFIPTGKAHERSRMPLFRVSRTADGRKGLLVYILDDAVWAPKTDGANVEGEEFKAISLEDMILRSV
ncbi:G-patch domain-containing protein [Psilocybe cubensis]|uniref:G-patch domain-containing protein n=2 Tax=Psilocybe cubensis TaxID=181762 RepID=A0A8H7XVT4_PSICU|nr:G-patch domain-containing protein [Psilocybe cubensis]KAH9479550.1 G-patch domain-containing protein [Psilocybe cubensis]